MILLDRDEYLPARETYPQSEHFSFRETDFFLKKVIFF